jgi:hypothetical protein
MLSCPTSLIARKNIQGLSSFMNVFRLTLWFVSVSSAFSFVPIGALFTCVRQMIFVCTVHTLNVELDLSTQARDVELFSWSNGPKITTMSWG